MYAFSSWISRFCGSEEESEMMVSADNKSKTEVCLRRRVTEGSEEHQDLETS